MQFLFACKIRLLAVLAEAATFFNVRKTTKTALPAFRFEINDTVLFSFYCVEISCFLYYWLVSAAAVTVSCRQAAAAAAADATAAVAAAAAAAAAAATRVYRRRR